MSNRIEDYLWDPQANPDPEIIMLERALRHHSATALQLAERPLPTRPPVRIATRKSHRWIGWTAIAAAASIAGVLFAGLYRLGWA